MPRPHKLLVVGSWVFSLTLTSLLSAAVALAWMGQLQLAGLLISAVVSRWLPVARGRPGDKVKVVRRGDGAVLRGQLPTTVTEPRQERPTPPERRRTPPPPPTGRGGGSGPPEDS